MALILLLQEFDHTGTDGRDIYEQYFFNTDTIAVVENASRALGLQPYEMATGQRIWSAFGIDYFYDGDGGFYDSIPVVTAALVLSAAPPEGGTAVDVTATGPYESGEAVSILATPASGYIFVSWTRLGAVISTSAAHTYTMPFGGSSLVANFQEATPPPAPTPLSSKFYDLELRIRGLQIAIPPFVQRRIEGMLSDAFEGDHSYPVNFPLSPEEMIALGLPNDPQSDTDYSEPIPAEIWSHGNFLYKAYLDVLKSDDTHVRSSVILDSGFFISRNQTLTLPECYADEDPIDISVQPVIAVGGFEIRFNYRTISVRINTTTWNFVKEAYADHILMLEAVADWLESLGLGLKVTIEYSEDLTDETSKIIYWDTSVVTDCEIKVANINTNTWETSRYSRARYLTSKRMDMTTWNNVDETNRIAFPSVYNRNLYDGVNNLHDGIVNRYDEVGNLYFSNVKYLTYNESFRWEHCIVPYLYLTDVVKQIFRHLNIEVSGEFFDHDLIKRMLVYNNRTIDYVSVKINGTPSRRTALAIYHGDDNPDQESYWYENTHDFTIRLANHAPEYTVTEFLKGLKNFFGLKYDFSILQNRVEIRFVRSKIRSRQFLDLTRQTQRLIVITHGKSTGFAFTYDSPDPILQDGAGNPPPADEDVDFTVQNYLALDALDAELFEIAFVESLRAWFQLTPDQANPPYWKLYAFRQQSDVTLSGVEGSTDRNSTKRTWNLTLYPLVDSYITGKKMPAIECTANQPEANLSNKESGLRIMAFYGQQQDAVDQPYAFASCTRYDAKELLSEDQYDLDIRSEDIYPLHADQERIITAGKEMEAVILLDNYNIQQLSATPIIRIANLDYLIEINEIQHSTREHSVAKVILYKLK